MALDRRILSILYYNNIVDVNKIDEFIGEKDKYYLVKINGKIQKLKIPGNSYEEEIYNEFGLKEVDEEKSKVEDNSETINYTFVQKTIEDELLEVVKESKNNLLSVNKEVLIIENVVKDTTVDDESAGELKVKDKPEKTITTKRTTNKKATTTKRTTKKKK